MIVLKCVYREKQTQKGGLMLDFKVYLFMFSSIMTSLLTFSSHLPTNILMTKKIDHLPQVILRERNISSYAKGPSKFKVNKDLCVAIEISDRIEDKNYFLNLRRLSKSTGATIFFMKQDKNDQEKAEIMNATSIQFALSHGVKGKHCEKVLGIFDGNLPAIKSQLDSRGIKTEIAYQVPVQG